MQMQMLKILQKKAIRILFSARFNTHCSPLYALSGITPIDEAYQREALIFMKKYCNNLQPKAFNEIIKDMKNDNLRSSMSKKFNISTDLKKQDCFYSIISTWNCSEKDIKDAKTHQEVKSLLKSKSIKKQNEIKCEVKNCYSCRKDAKRDFSKYMNK